MENNLNFEAEERKAGRKAATTLRKDIRSQIQRFFHERSGDLAKSTVTSRYKDGQLDRLVLNMPRYSFQSHFGSTKTGIQKPTSRKGAEVKGFQRHVKGKTIDVQSYTRSGGNVVGFNKNRNYRAYNHIARVLQQTKALEVLATDLGNNRAILITSQIDF